MFSLPRHATVTATAIVVAATFLFAFLTSSLPSKFQDTLYSFRAAPAETRQLHYLLPATAANLNFCRLLLTSAITGYPEPILIGWEGHGKYDGAQSHLFKISETLAYLRGLPASNDDDLVLLIDAYDVVMLMPPEVMISRYFDLLETSNDRLRHEGILGQHHGGDEIRNTLFWGPDKTCWPYGSERAACWAIPEAPMRPKAFGPDTDSWMVLARPRWLNSGTLIGPAKHMRDMFNATMTMVEREYDSDFRDHNSDQYYFQDVWAEQEVERIRRRDGGIRPPVVAHNDAGEAIRGKVPDIQKGQRTEYHISLDYDSDLFQTAAGYTEYLAWMTFNHTSEEPTSGPPRRKRLDEVSLPDDLNKCKPPFEVSEGVSDSVRDILPSLHWKDVLLGINVVTQRVFPLLHYTGDKGFRDRWWPNLWFHPYAEALFEARTTIPEGLTEDVIATVGGVRWTGANTSTWTRKHSRGGAWSDLGVHLRWDGLCVNHEKDLFLRP